MDQFDMLGKWFWVVFIVVTFANAAIFKFRSIKQVKVNPDLSEGYSKVIKGFVLWCNIPLLIMGLGCTIGGVPSVFHYFNPKSCNPYILAFFGSIFLIWCLGTYWLLFRDGAEILVKHPGMFNFDFKNPTMVKLFWFACLAGGILGVVMMFTQDIPMPNI